MPNTFDSALVNTVVKDRVVTILQSRLCAFNAFSTDFSLDPLAPGKTIEVPYATAAATGQKNPTDWESGDATLSKIEVDPDEYSQSFHITNAELQTGHRLERLLDVNLGAFADTLMDAAMAPITVANFGAATVTAAAAAFGADEMRQLYGALKKSNIKNAVLDSDYFARFLPDKLDQIGPRPGLCGFSNVFENTRFNGADANVTGFACNPQAVGLGSALPVVAPGAEREFIELSTITVPGIGLSVQFSIWFSKGTRKLWAAFDVLFGAAKGDTTALKLVKSA